MTKRKPSNQFDQTKFCQSVRKRYRRRFKKGMNATDAEISKIAANTKIGLVTSINEGFGLPILEFRNYGLIVVAPDIEVFHEIDDDFVVFYEPNNLKSLAEICLNQNLQFKPNNLNSNRTWKNFTKEIIKFIESE